MKIPTRMRRLSGLEEHFMRRRSSDMRSVEGTSSKLTAELLAIAVVSSENRDERGCVVFCCLCCVWSSVVLWGLAYYFLRTFQRFKLKLRSDTVFSPHLPLDLPFYPWAFRIF